MTALNIALFLEVKQGAHEKTRCQAGLSRPQSGPKVLK
jgi:hypothetical protein